MRMQSKQNKILLFLLILFLLIGAVSGVYAVRDSYEPPWWTLSSTVLVSVAGFYWYHLDSTRHNYARSIWLNLGVVAVAPLAVPYYVYSVTPAGARLRALGRLVGFFLLLMAATMVGATIGAFTG